MIIVRAPRRREDTKRITFWLRAFVSSWLSVALVAAPSAQSRTRLVMLGTGTPNADPDRYGPAVAVTVDDASYLVDAGVGVVRRAAAAERAGVTALAATKLKRVFIT